ncbi:hypothetical protein OUZ56_027368 [Daphnia magna]|uniref:Uncharacterized protein n=1 Tax=Daphnia magna TaxID=35525 RepID=A0ABQ9ZPY5_9CRUS|nr:hypothetical protein OUZ56_027368 [Daphnia magna]
MSIWKLACFFVLVLFVSDFVTFTDASPSLPRPIDQSVEGINGFSSEKPLEKRSVRSLTSSTGMERDQRLFWKVTWLVKTVNGISNAVKKG